MKTFMFYTAFAALLILTGCASTYRQVNPVHVKYNANTMDNGK